MIVSTAALEIGCAEGIFTELLSPRCNELLAIDITDVAVTRARKRLAGKPWINVVRRTFPEEIPGNSFDLVTCIDVLYYCDVDRLHQGLRKLASLIQPGGTFLALHYLGDAQAVISGAEVHRVIPEALKEFCLTSSERRLGVGPRGAGYQLDRYDRM